jgi:predicted GNAT family acetyltransferase
MGIIRILYIYCTPRVFVKKEYRGQGIAEELFKKG